MEQTRVQNHKPHHPVAENVSRDETEQRRARRLSDLGINPAGVLVIIKLHRQVMGLTARVAQLENALQVQRSNTEARLLQFRQKYLEGDWLDPYR
ncbi:MAG: hypothetical protein JWP00_4810 [Chloroflexi bacterium]|jgi:hypothetical protein|nr:hypothetical protein [Chloroflexota bacterium]